MLLTSNSYVLLFSEDLFVLCDGHLVVRKPKKQAVGASYRRQLMILFSGALFRTFPCSPRVGN